MRGRRFMGVVCALSALVTGLLAGCRGASGDAGDGPPGGPSAASRTAGYGARFLAVGECSSFGTTRFAEVPCTGERAAARVVARYDGAVGDGLPCPATTDFVLHISARQPTGEGSEDGEDGEGTFPVGYACMRRLEPPHPGDPGGGGGPRTIAGDCVYGTGAGQVRETACDGSGSRKPQFKVVETVTSRDRCPATTALYVQLGGERPVGCARRL
ncbi:hypothetical protein ACWEKM_17790 [Streptomyces sp. NPDC004752]